MAHLVLKDNKHHVYTARTQRLCIFLEHGNRRGVSQ